MQTFAAAIMLALGALAYDTPYLGGELHSKETFKYGKFVTYMKTSEAKGTGSSFYLYAIPEQVNHEIWEEWNSINVIPSHEPPVVTKMSQQMGQPYDVYSGFNPVSFHKYTIEWTPEYMSYSIDDKEIRRLEDEQISGLSEPQNLVMSLITFADEDHVGKDLDQENPPFFTRLDYVEVYDYSLTNKEFNLRFRDDFDVFDSQRWGRGDNKHWEGKNSTFDPENVYTEGGKLVLKVKENEQHHSNNESDDEESDGSDHDSDHDSDNEDDHDSDDDDDDSDHDSSEHFHVLPSPKKGTLDAAIESATRVALAMARTTLDHFAESMGQHLQ